MHTDVLYFFLAAILVFAVSAGLVGWMGYLSTATAWRVIKRAVGVLILGIVAVLPILYLAGSTQSAAVAVIIFSLTLGLVLIVSGVLTLGVYLTPSPTTNGKKPPPAN